MSEEQALPQRKKMRLPGYDYSQPGYYLVTICTHHRRLMLGRIINEEMRLSRWGQIAQTIWNILPERFPNLELDQYIFMPNHMHGILVLKPLDTHDFAPKVLVHEIVRTFKSLVTRRIHALGELRFRWQGKYHDHIIRNDADLSRIREYIINNPARWAEDAFYRRQPPQVCQRPRLAIVRTDYAV